MHKGATPMFPGNNFKHWLLALVLSVGVVVVLAHPCDPSTEAPGEIQPGLKAPNRKGVTEHTMST